MKLKNYLLVLMAAFVVVSCGSDNSEDGNLVSTVNSPSVPNNNNNPNNPNNNNPAPNPTAVPSSAGCPQYPARSFYSYTGLSSSGDSGVVRTTSNHIVADSKLRVSIEPNPGTDIQNNYTTLAGKASLYKWKNGVKTLVATKSFPTPSTQVAADNYSYKVGIPVGYKSHPQYLDFSSYLSGSYKYSVEVHSVLTDKKCRTYCSPNGEQYAGTCVGANDPYSQYCNMSGYGFNWTINYSTGAWFCCHGTMVQSCQRTYCGVGNMSGIPNTTWSVSVYVETDNTSCIE